jgi:chromosome segregation ATPase
MMRSAHSLIWVVIGAGLLTLAGCSGAPADSTEIKKLQADLKDANGQNEILKKDTQRLAESLKQAESSLADTTDARNRLQVQVEDLTKSRDELTARVGELGIARTGLQSKVDELTAKVAELGTVRTGLQSRVDELTKTVEGLAKTRTTLEKQVADLTKARNLALDDARNAQGKIEQLNTKLKVQTQQMTELQDQIVNIRAVLDHLQQNLQ